MTRLHNLFAFLLALGDDCSISYNIDLGVLYIDLS